MLDVNVVPGGSTAYNALLYPENNPLNMEYFNNNLSRLNEYVGMVSNTFVDKVKNVYNAFNDSSIINIAKAALQKSKGVIRPDLVYPIEVDNLNQATGVMQRWIMAEPVIRDLYLKQECDGFSDTYIDIDPGTIKDDHYDYRRVMNGVLREDSIFDEIDDDESWQINFYTEALLDDSDELTSDKQLDILYTWENVQLAIARGVDPTDPFNGSL